MINEVLRKNHEDNGAWYFWVVDDINELPDLLSNPVSGTQDDVDENWRSPFAGASIQEAVEYLRNVLKPRKPLCKKYFALLERQRYERHGQLLICNIVNGEVQSIPCIAWWAGTWLMGHDRDVWGERYECWTEGEQPIA
ncbi:hypothetical protein AC579_6696 [Pseudocercospora musae]|uniref:Uncharacterized protein n=1 Tax=Pseudocercospora musae TaxID=113226 RepID=A0A139HZN3_9PEZI|nr:hypothetical protein AC579_6696 [Pseudocercospora musae]